MPGNIGNSFKYEGSLVTVPPYLLKTATLSPHILELLEERKNTIFKIIAFVFQNNVILVLPAQ